MFFNYLSESRSEVPGPKTKKCILSEYAITTPFTKLEIYIRYTNIQFVKSLSEATSTYEIDTQK